MTITNFDCSRGAATALAAFRQETGSDREDSLGDLLCDLMVWADTHKLRLRGCPFSRAMPLPGGTHRSRRRTGAIRINRVPAA